ncbi:MAG: hypothetical protein II336_18035 [Loktanella sp.]|nr:hypothetical protein [Loktanella sp.]
MKARQPGETDASYIARLEAANADLRMNNKRSSEAISRVYEIATVAASRTGLLFDYAADICGMADTPEHVAIKKALAGLCHMQWQDGVPSIPDKPQWKVANPDPPSDAGMILRSALEICKAATPPWEFQKGMYPDYLAPIDRWDMETVRHEIFDALQSLEFSRGLLRDDLRSAMFDHCISQIARAARVGGDIAEPSAEPSDSMVDF